MKSNLVTAVLQINLILQKHLDWVRAQCQGESHLKSRCESHFVDLEAGDRNVDQKQKLKKMTPE